MKDLLRQLQQQGINLWLEGESLRFSAPQGVMTDEIKSEIRTYKPEIIAFLQQEKLLNNHPQFITKINRESSELSLSFAQERLWFIDQFEGKTPFYNLNRILKLKGNLNINALEKAIKYLLKRQESLRTNFYQRQGKPYLQIQELVDFSLPVINLDNLDIRQQELTLNNLIEQELNIEFNLETDRLVKFTLIKLNHQEHILIMVIHHIITDGWSMGILTKELCYFYESFIQNISPSLPNLPIQYVDFALWQRQYLQENLLTKQLDYWKKQLEDVPSNLSLPIDKSRPQNQTFKGKTIDFFIKGDLTQKLRHLSHNNNVTLFVTLLSGFSILLSRYSHQEDFVIGSAIANRNYQEIENLIGFFVNSLPLRIKAENNLTFSQLLAQVKETAFSAYENQDIPFEKLVQELKIERNLAYHPLFQVMFALQNFPQNEWKLPELSIELMSYESEVSKFDLTVFLWEVNSGLKGMINFNTDLFEDDTIKRMSLHFENLLSEIIKNPEQKISEIPLLTETEKQQILIDWNQTKVDYPQDKCIHQLFEAQVIKTPDNIAIVFEEEKLTYQELNEKANQLAHYLQELGVKKGSFIGIFLVRSPLIIISMLAILKVGCAYIPLDINYPQERIKFMVEDANIPLIISEAKLENKLLIYQGNIIKLDGDEKQIIKQCKENLEVKINSDNLAYLIYTSGSTGKPKGVKIKHKSVNRLVINCNYISIDAKDKIAQIANTSFDATTFEIWGALLNGCQCIIFNKEVLNANNIKQFINHYNITISWLTSSLFNSIIDHDISALSELKYLLVGGESLSIRHIKLALKNMPKTIIINGYGPTENTTFSSTYIIPQKLNISLPFISIGKPINNTKIYILDSYLQALPIGVQGELYIGGEGLAEGYLNRPKLTAEKFIDNPFDSGKLYKTGDLARYLPDGNIEFIGRKDEQVKIRGFRIELGEIENNLLQYPHIKETVVMALENEKKDKYLVAYIITSQSIEIREIREYLAQKLPDYMIPSAFIFLDKFPLTPNGKIDKKALPKADFDTYRENEFIAPRNEIEMKLAQIWQETLNIDNIGINDNFFALGGHSLLATQIVSKLVDNFTINIPLKLLFEKPNIKDLAEYINQQLESDSEKKSLNNSCIVIINDNGDKCPLYFINSTKVAYDLQNYLGKNQPLYSLNIFGLTTRINKPFNQLTIADLATYMIEDLLKFKSQDEYQLIGYCQDGALTLEIAQQLQKLGKQIKLLCLVDVTFDRNKKQSNKFLNRLQMIKDFQLMYLQPRIKRYLSQISNKFNFAQKNNQSLEDKELQEKISLDKQLYQSYYQLFMSYKPSGYDGEIVSIESKEFSLVDRPTLKVIAKQGLKSENVDAIHHSLFEAHIDLFAQTLQKYLS